MWDGSGGNRSACDSSAESTCALDSSLLASVYSSAKCEVCSRGYIMVLPLKFTEGGLSWI